MFIVVFLQVYSKEAFLPCQFLAGILLDDFFSYSSGAKPTLSLGIAHNYGTIREISWCPSGTWESVSSKQYEVNNIN